MIPPPLDVKRSLTLDFQGNRLNPMKVTTAK